MPDDSDEYEQLHAATELFQCRYDDDCLPYAATHVLPIADWIVQEYVLPNQPVI